MTNDVPKDAREVYLNEKGEAIAYCPVDSFGATDFERIMFYNQNRERLLEFAAKAAKRGDGAVVVCIDVDDPKWTALAEALMPGHDWDEYRARGEKPVARGIAMRTGMQEIIADEYPAAGQLKTPTEGVNILVFAAGGVGIF